MTWSQYKELMPVKDKEKREEYIEIIKEESLSVRELRLLIAEEEQKQTPVSDTGQEKKKLSFTRGIPFVYKIKRIDYLKPNNSYTLQKTEVPLNQIYTYKTYLEKVLDGDTFWATLDLGFKIFIRQKIRLHKIDAPLLETEQGKKAMNYLHNKLKPLDFIVVKTHWRDKFDRYLSDIFYLPNEEDFLKVIQKGKFLNQELVDKGYCRIVASS